MKDMLDVQIHALDRIYRAFDQRDPRGPQQPMCRYPDLVEGPSPAADSGTAGVGILYPVTCAARYYDAASKILEDEPNLFTHENADELGHVIQKWIEETRDNWEPR